MSTTLLAAATAVLGWGRQASPPPPPPPEEFPAPYVYTFVYALFGLHMLTWLLLFRLGQEGQQAHLGGHFASSLLGFFALAVVGVQGWVLGGYHDELQTGTSLGRLVGEHPMGTVATNMMFGFQTYEVAAALLVPELRGKSYEMLAHHSMTLLLAGIGGVYAYVNYFGSFFFAFSELSSCALAFVDLFKQYPGLPAKYPQFHELVRTVFAVLFLLVRVAYWPYVSAVFWMDSYEGFSLPEIVGSKGPVPVPAALAFNVCNVFLTGMQFFWGSLVIKAVLKKSRGQKVD